MKVSVKRNDLDKALGTVARAVSTRALGSYQQFVKITASEGAISLEATDDELYIKVDIAADVAEAGDLLVSPLICDLVGKMAGENIEIVKDGGKLTIKGGRSRYQLVCAATDIFPRVAEYKQGKFVSVKSGVLADALGKTTFCAYKGAGERSSYYTSGVLFRFTPEFLDMVATDGHRLGLKKCRGKFVEESQDIMMPAHNADELMRFLPADPETAIEIYLSPSQVYLEWEGMLVASSLLDVKFPDYSRVIPQDRATSVLTDRREMHDALRRAIIVSRAKQHNPVVRLKSHDGVISLYTDATDVGSGEEDIACEVTGGDMEIAVNPGYLVDVLGQLGTEKVVLYWNSKVTPLVISSPEDQDFTYVVMPIRME
ncbi:MAG: DNA polymerase III subunit beta [bacterium]|jgi:DNA polymerase-3 subunit beta